MFDDNDLKILVEFSKLSLMNEEVTSWEMMKRVFKNGKKREHMLVLRRIRKMSEYGLFHINGNYYTLDATKVFYRNFSFPTRRVRGLAVSVDGKYQIFEI